MTRSFRRRTASMGEHLYVSHSDSACNGRQSKTIGSLVLLASAISGCGSGSVARDSDAAPTPPSVFAGSMAGEERQVLGIRFCWCPPGTFTMGSPPGEPERRPGEDQVEVTLTRGFWMSKYEVTQG